MALEASDMLIDIIWVNWRCTYGCISRPTFKLSASLLDIMGKSKEISQDLHKSGSSLGAISKRLKVPRSSVQKIVRKYKHHGTRQQSYRSVRRRVLSPRDERTLVQKGQINPRTTAKDLVKMLEETGTKVSISTVKRVLYLLNLHGRSAMKKPLLLNHHKKARLRFATAHGDKDRTFLIRQTYNCFAIMTIIKFGGKRGMLASWRTPSQPWSTGVAASCCGGALLQEGLVNFTK